MNSLDILMKETIGRPLALLLLTCLCTIGLAEESDRKEWDFSTIDSAGFNSSYNCAICLDTLSQPHVFYEGRGKGATPMVSGDFTHAFLHDGVWKKHTVDSGCSVSDNIYPAFNNLGTPYVLYRISNSKGRDGLKYAFKISDRWVIQDIFKNSRNIMPKPCSNFCFTIDKKDILHLCYLDREKDVLIYGRKSQDQSHWQWKMLEDVGPQEISALRIWPSIATGTDDKVFVAYKKYKSRGDGKILCIELRLATLSGNKWSFETVEENLGYIDGTSRLVIDSRQRPHIVYDKIAPSSSWGMLPDMCINYVVKERDKWRREKVYTLLEAEGRFELSLTAEDNPYILVTEMKMPMGKGPRRGNLMLASREKDGWSIETILENEISSWGADFSIDRTGCAHVVFPAVIRAANEQLVLKYGKCNLKH